MLDAGNRLVYGVVGKVNGGTSGHFSAFKPAALSCEKTIISTWYCFGAAVGVAVFVGAGAQNAHVVVTNKIMTAK